MEKKLENNKTNKGITLVALVVTIIILLILTGVTLASLTGEKGLIKEARTAKELAEKAALEEQVELAIIKAEQKHRNPGIDDVIEEIKNNKVISNVDQVNKETGAIRTDAGYEITGKLDDYIGKISTGDGAGDNTGDNTGGNTGGNTGDNTGGTSEKIIAKEVLKIDPTATEAKDKSPYVRYNGIACRVLYNDETHGLQIIAGGNLSEYIILGCGDSMVTASNFTYSGSATVNNNFKIAAASYNNAVDNLNKKAKSYMDTKGIAIDARCLGGVPTLTSESKFYGDTSGMWYGSYNYLSKYSWNNKFKNEDINYSEDVKQLKDLTLDVTSGGTWLASRFIYSGSAGSYVSVRSTSINNNFCDLNGDGSTDSYAPSHGFRPVFLLPSDLIISSGDGSSGNPYVIE